jgi:hypothetical protein
MIRSCTLIEFAPGTSEEYVAEITRQTEALEIEGMRSIHAAPDLGIKDGNMHYAVVADLNDAAAYRRYDTDPEHERIRRELTRPVLVRYERVQYELPDA